MRETYDVAIVGGGAVGLGLAGELAGNGADVVLLEKGNVGREASYASGGMLSPFMELDSYETSLLSFGRESLGMYPQFRDSLEEETGEEVGLRGGGTLYVAHHEDQTEVIERLFEFQQKQDVDARWLEQKPLTKREPTLSDRVKAGIVSPEEMRVNNRRLTLALMLRCRYRGVEIRSHEPVVELKYDGDRVSTVRTSRGGVSADRYVIAAGAWSSELDGLKQRDRVPVRPVKGQAVAVQLSDDFRPAHTVRTPDVYCVPHPPERLIIGATSEERGFDGRVTAGAVLELISDGSEVLPGILDQPVLETWAGLRPASRDNKPVLGPAPVTDNLWYATGHYRSGMLLLPATIKYLVRYMETGGCPDPLKPFQPSRFRSTGSRSESGTAGQSPRESTPC